MSYMEKDLINDTIKAVKKLIIPVVVGQSELLRSSCNWCNGNNQPKSDRIAM